MTDFRSRMRRCGWLVLAICLAAGTRPALAERSADPPEPTGASAMRASDAAPETVDPWERFNRRSYAFSMGLDQRVVAPIVRGYARLTPRPVQRALGNVLANMREPRITLNDLLQGRPQRAGVAASRFLVNASVGLLGAFDPAARWGLQRHPADFGQTLGRYGVGPGPFLYLPLIGPIDVRDGVGRLVDAATDPVSLVAGGVGTAFGGARLAASAVDARATLGPQLETLNTQATDPYAATRSVYAQRRGYLVREAAGKQDVLPDFEPAPDTSPPPQSAAAPQADR